MQVVSIATFRYSNILSPSRQRVTQHDTGYRSSDGPCTMADVNEEVSRHVCKLIRPLPTPGGPRKEGRHHFSLIHP